MHLHQFLKTDFAIETALGQLHSNLFTTYAALVKKSSLKTQPVPWKPPNIYILPLTEVRPGYDRAVGPVPVVRAVISVHLHDKTSK